MDYLSYWSLIKKPFADSTDPLFFAGVPQREAIAGLSYFVTRQLNTAFFVAPRRCGMTRLLQHVTRMQGFGDCAAEVVVTDGTHLRCDAIQRELCGALGYPSVVDDGAEELDRTLQSSAQQGVQTVWLIDRCKSTAARLARDLALTHANLSVVIGTTPEETKKHVVQFGRCGMRIDLPPLSLEDTIEYLRFSLEHAGCTRQLFPDSTAVRLHELSGGALAQLSWLAESALALAASHGIDKIGAEIIEAVQERMAWAA